MYDRYHSRPWKRTRRERPCGLAYNTGRCPDKDNYNCPFSHEPRDITSWRDSRGLMPCAYGPRCDQFTRKECVYSHPSSPLSPMYRNEKSKFYTQRLGTSERQQRMLEDLVILQPLDGLSTKGSTGPSTGVRLSITKEKFLASYNKIADNKIAVPGLPQNFVPPTKTLSVKLDADEQQDPKNSKGSRRAYPTYTHNLEPLVCAVECMTKKANSMLETTDIVANAGSFYRIFHYLSGNAVSAHRFDLEWRPKEDGSGGALLMQQWNADPDHKVSYGRGNNFASMTCHYPDDAPDILKDSFTHHRVVSYKFGSLQCVIHCEADGYYEPAGVDCASPADIPMKNTCWPTPPPTRRQSFVQAMSQTGHRRRMSTYMPPTPPMTPPGFTSYLIGPPGGSRFAFLSMEDTEDNNDNSEKSDILNSDTLDITLDLETRTPAPEKYVEIKTFSMARKGLAVPPEPQLYFARTKQLYTAGHMYGSFQASGSSGDDQVKDMTEALRQWEDNQQDILARVHTVMVKIRKLSSEMAAKGHTKLSLVCPGPDEPAEPMRVFIRNDSRSFLPEDV